MTDLTAMWAALEKYQPFADADGHGETWRVMCSKRTTDASWAAAWVAEARAAGAAKAAAWAAWEAAAYAAEAAAEAYATAEARAAYWSDRSIEHIEKAIKERT
jgi:hypothetical protein